MNLYLKLVFACVLGCILALIVKKHSPEISILISVSIVIASLLVTVEVASNFKSYFESMEIISYLPKESFGPMIKCIAISVITQFASAICKDTGQTAVAYGVEFTGSIVLILCMMPLIGVLFQLIGGII